jgi:hypothetical protein
MSSDKNAVASGAQVVDGARKRQVASAQSPVSTPPAVEVDDKKKLSKKVLVFRYYFRSADDCLVIDTQYSQNRLLRSSMNGKSSLRPLSSLP